ncbi:MAG: rod shape-determining protein MreC [Pseudomonadota bacterium]
MVGLGQERREGIGRKPDSRVTLLLLFLVSFFFLLSSLYAAEASVFRKARESALEVASPVLSVFAGPAAFIQDRIGSVRDYFAVLEQNKALREENAALREWAREARSLRTIVATYEDLGAYRAPPPIAPINAFVVGETNDAFAHSMILNAGRKDSVARGQAVVDAEGLIGRIVDVSNSASRVLLLTDVQSRVPVYVEGAEIEGILAGRTSSRPTISFVLSADVSALEAGQTVFTSGAGGTLPRGLPIGEIVRPSAERAEVKLAANFAKTRLVRVINYEFTGLSEDVLEEGADSTDGIEEVGGADENAASVVAPNASVEGVTPVTPASTEASTTSDGAE